ncbi:hydroxymethylglutaryl-CoA lyase [Methylobacterium brachiatum]|uniref:hydroxymethylglutaryl-CoA lyase n=1 Tax=Methylobacterium brachiatum TaxID=269660 RepID=UPI0024490D13|nr:hydroxymethylglutaryl-CoA lyase [Methylobacterium brachiatum]MDH2313208.1 hydroxymethylglutaryl-CoA lyase [Methylobacterium brachiatum]
MSDATMLVQDVAPRDGLQIEAAWVETADKIALVDALSDAGFSRIEVSSFVSPKAVPALRDAAELFAGIRRRPGTVYVALVPNPKGAERALAAKVDEINLVASVSETHNRANMGMSPDDSIAGFARIMETVTGASVLTNATVATAFGCPFEGDQPVDKVIAQVERYRSLGITGVTLADTTGMANPRQVERLVARVLAIVPAEHLTLHFHNTRGVGLANVLAAWQAGARRFDAALGGLGGCPFAPGATGNICTEDLVSMAHEMGIRTGLDLPALIALSRDLPRLVGHEVPGQVAKAGRPCDLHPVPRAA